MTLFLPPKAIIGSVLIGYEWRRTASALLVDSLLDFLKACIRLSLGKHEPKLGPFSCHPKIW